MAVVCVHPGFGVKGHRGWAEKVYEPDVVNDPGKLCKKPGYSM